MNSNLVRGVVVLALFLCTILVIFTSSSRYPMILTSTGLFDVIPHTRNESVISDSREPIALIPYSAARNVEKSSEPTEPEPPAVVVTRAPTTGWRAQLYTPTHIVFYSGMWLIVDCWHHRLLYSAELDAPISRWSSVLEDVPAGGVIVPHSVATDGVILVTESSVDGSNGDDHTLIVFQRKEDRFVTIQTLLACPGNKARRPHRVIYDDVSKAFYLYLTNPPHLAKFTRSANNSLVIDYCQPVPSMNGQYARSILIRNSSLFITAGPKAITELRLTPTVGTPFSHLRSYPSKRIGITAGKMNDLAFIDGWWYATSTRKCGIGRFRDIGNPRGTYQDLTPTLKLCRRPPDQNGRCTGGTPYYVTSFKGRVYVPYIFGCSGIVSFVDEGNTISDVKQHWGGGWVETSEDVVVRGTKW